MTPHAVTPPARPGLRVVLRGLAATLFCLLAWGIGTAGCWSKRASQPPPHTRPMAG